MNINKNLPFQKLKKQIQGELNFDQITNLYF